MMANDSVQNVNNRAWSPWTLLLFQSSELRGKIQPSGTQTKVRVSVLLLALQRTTWSPSLGKKGQLTVTLQVSLGGFGGEGSRAAWILRGIQYFFFSLPLFLWENTPMFRSMKGSVPGMYVLKQNTLEHSLRWLRKYPLKGEGRDRRRLWKRQEPLCVCLLLVHYPIENVKTFGK